MKKSVIVLWVLAALFLVGSVSLLSQGDIGAGVFGLVASAVLGFFGYIQYKKHLVVKAQAEEKARREREEKERKAAEEAQRRAEREAYRATVDRYIFTVAGVTFKNDGGRSRQTILREIKHNEPSVYEFELKQYDFKGEPAVGVYLNDEQVGSISRDDLPTVLPIIKKFDRLEAYDVKGGGKFEDGTKVNYGFDIAVYFKK